MNGSGKKQWQLSLPGGNSAETRRNVWLPGKSDDLTDSPQASNASNSETEQRVRAELERSLDDVMGRSPSSPPKKKIKKPKLTRLNKKRRTENLNAALLFVRYAPYTSIHQLFFDKSGTINATGLHMGMRQAIQKNPGRYSRLEDVGGLLSLDRFQELIGENRDRFETRDDFEQRHRKKSGRESTVPV